MFLNKLPQKAQRFATYLVLTASVSLFAVTAFAGSYGHKTNKDIVETASSNDVIHVIDEVILPN